MKIYREASVPVAIRFCEILQFHGWLLLATRIGHISRLGSKSDDRGRVNSAGHPHRRIGAGALTAQKHRLVSVPAQEVSEPSNRGRKIFCKTLESPRVPVEAGIL